MQLFDIGAGSLLETFPAHTGPVWGIDLSPDKVGCTVVFSIERFHCTQDSQLGPNGVLYREVPLYTGQPAGSQWCPL